MKKIKCPVCLGKEKDCLACHGTGKVNPPKPKNYKRDVDGQNKATAHILSDYGYTLREIAEMLGYKHPQSIKNLLDKKLKNE
jgi:hypothetical protein